MNEKEVIEVMRETFYSFYGVSEVVLTAVNIRHCLFVYCDNEYGFYALVKLVTDEPTNNNGSFVPDLSDTYYPVLICTNEHLDKIMDIYNMIISC